MERVEVSAPGKLVLIGEYAVLFGAPAAVAAVDRRAVITLDRAAGDSWQVSAPGFAPRPATFEFQPGGTVCWRDEALGRESFALVERVVAGVGAAELATLPPLAIILDTRAFFDPATGGGTKLGLGSSAALTVALATAFETRLAGGDLSRSDPGRLQRLVDLHRAVQEGTGSGIDVAASLLGGVVRYRLDENGAVAEAASMTLPNDLWPVFAWTGRAASTGDFLARLESRLAESPDEVRPALDMLGAVSTAGAAALSEGRTGGFLDVVDGFWDALDRLGGAIGMPILSDEHVRLRAVAAECGVRYKPSGAGGGDFGIGFAGESAAAAVFSERVAAEGFRTIGLNIDPKGAY